MVEEPYDEFPYYFIPRPEAPSAPVAAGISKVDKIILKYGCHRVRRFYVESNEKNKQNPKGTFYRLCNTWCNSVATWMDHSRSRSHRAAV